MLDLCRVEVHTEGTFCTRECVGTSSYPCSFLSLTTCEDRLGAACFLVRGVPAITTLVTALVLCPAHPGQLNRSRMALPPTLKLFQATWQSKQANPCYLNCLDAPSLNQQAHGFLACVGGSLSAAWLTQPVHCDLQNYLIQGSGIT